MISARASAAACALAVALARTTVGACPEPAATGVQPCDAALRTIFQSASDGALGDAGFPAPRMNSGTGAARHDVAGHVPCVLLSAVAQTESSWYQFGPVACGASAPTLISFDCGYGIGQITSGMDGSEGFAPSRVAAEPAYNISVEVNDLIGKWQVAPDLGANDPHIAEDWYFALWGYNGFAASNNPNQHPDTRGTYYDPAGAAYPRNHYPYEEIVYGYARNPPDGPDGAPLWPAVAITQPDYSQICGACGEPDAAAAYSQPMPTHTGDCAAAPTPDWAAQFVAQSFPLASAAPLQVHAGDAVDAWIELRNVGARPWDANTRLGTTQPRDRASAFAGPGWLRDARAAGVNTTVPPGGTFRFAFTLHAPATPGRYDEHFGVVQEGVAWFSDPSQGGPPDEQLEGVFEVLPGAATDHDASVHAMAGGPGCGCRAAPDATAAARGALCTLLLALLLGAPRVRPARLAARTPCFHNGTG